MNYIKLTLIILSTLFSPLISTAENDLLKALQSDKFLEAPEKTKKEVQEPQYKYQPSSAGDILLSQDAKAQQFFLQGARFRFYTIIALCIISITFLTLVLKYLTKTDYLASDVVNASALILIVFGTIILVMVVDTEEQLMAATGILGAIAGYLFGSMRRTGDRT